MLKAPHISAAGATKRSKFALPDTFGEDIHEGAMYHAVRAFLSNRRQGTHATKTRSEVSGGGRKPYKQKGTGRARQGTTRAPQWRGGGIAFGPKPRKYEVKLPKKVKQLARQSALNARASTEALYVTEPLDFDKPSTRKLNAVLAKLDLEQANVLILTDGSKRNVYLSGRNLPFVHVMPFSEVTAFEILWSHAVLIEEAALGAGASAAEEQKSDG